MTELRRYTMLFKQLRSVALRHGKSGEYRSWLRARSQGLSLHHVFGSTMGRKSTDFLIVAVPIREHLEKQDDPEWNEQQVAQALDNLLTWIEETHGKD